MKMKINWKWPAAPGNNYAPGYLIVYRMLWAPLIYVGIAVTFVGVLLSNGGKHAKYWLERSL